MAQNKANSDYIDFVALLRDYLSKWYLFVISVVVCVGLAYVFAKRSDRPMVVKANILISQEDQGPFSSASGGGLSGLFGSNAYVEDEIFVISSHSLFRDVAKDLNLNKTHYVKANFLKSYLAYPDFPVDVTAPAGVADTITVGLSFKVDVDKEGMADITVTGPKKAKYAKVKDVRLPYTVKTPYGEFDVVATPHFPKGKKVSTVIGFTGYESAAEGLTDNVIADIASRKSNVITLEYDTPNPAYGSAILNRILARYNERGISEKNLQGEKTAAFIEDRLGLIGTQLSDVELKIQNYKTSHNITDIGVEAGYQQAKRGELDKALLEQEANVEMLRITRNFFADSLHSNELVPVIVENKGLQDAIATYNELIMQRIELAKDARPGNIALANLNERIALMRQNLYKSADKTLHQGMAAVADLRQELGLTREYLGNVPVQEREFVDLRRQQGMMARLYNFLLEKQEENSMLLANSVSKGKVIDEAYTLSEPLGASPKIILLMAFVIGLVIPPAGLFLYKLLRNKFESRAEVERHVSAPILGEMVTDNSGRKLVVTEKDTSPSTELFRLLRSNLQFMLGGSADRVVLVTSTVSGEGKSFISANMAASLSLLENKRVLLMGMDIRNPQLENYLDIHPAKGLTNYLSSDNVSVDEITVHMPGYKSLDVMVAGPIPPNPSELLASSKVGSLFEMLRSKYDYIVVDSAPVGMVSDTFTLNRFADATIYVTRVNYSSMHDLRFIEEIYQNKRLKNLSVVVNGTVRKKGYGYGYGRKAGER